MYFLQAFDMTAQMARLTGRVWEQNLAVGQVLWTAAMRQNMALLGFGRPIGVARPGASGPVSSRKVSAIRAGTRPACSTEWSQARPRKLAVVPNPGPSPLEV